MSFYNDDDNHNEDHWGFFVEIDSDISNPYSSIHYYYYHEGKKCSKCINLETIEEGEIDYEEDVVVPEEKDNLVETATSKCLKAFLNFTTYCCLIVTAIYFQIL